MAGESSRTAYGAASGHADLATAIKYGYRDLRPGLERLRRETAARGCGWGGLQAFTLTVWHDRGGYVTAVGEISVNVGECLIQSE